MGTSFPNGILGSLVILVLIGLLQATATNGPRAPEMRLLRCVSSYLKKAGHTLHCASYSDLMIFLQSALNR